MCLCRRWRGHTWKRQVLSAVFWCDLRYVCINTAWHLWGQTPIRKVSHTVMSALVKIVSETSLSHFTLNFYLVSLVLLLSYANFVTPNWPDFVLRQWYLPRGHRIHTVGSDSYRHATLKNKPKKERKSWLMFMWLALLHHWWNVDFLATWQECSYFPSGCCCFDPCRPCYWQLVVLSLQQSTAYFAVL